MTVLPLPRPLPDGATLRSLRVAAGVRLKDFAARLNYSVGHLSKVENGHMAPSAALVRHYQRAGHDATRGEWALLTMRFRDVLARPLAADEQWDLDALAQELAAVAFETRGASHDGRSRG